MDARIIELLVTVVVAVLSSNGLWTLIQSLSKQKSATDRMLLGLGHAEIFYFAERYIRRGGITMTELQDLEHYLYSPYAEMGGNGSAEEVVKRCNSLPIIDEAEAERRDALFRKGEPAKN